MEMEKKISEMIEPMVKIAEEMKEELNKLMKTMNEMLEEFEKTMLKAREELTMGLRDLSGDRVKRIGEVDEKPFVKVCEQKRSGENVELEDAMSCLKLQEALKDPANAPASRQVLNQRPKRVMKPNPRYRD